MKIFLRGHDNKYAAEQMLLTLYPDQRPEYPAGRPEGDRVELNRSRGAVYTTVTCLLWKDGVCHTGRAAMVIASNQLKFYSRSVTFLPEFSMTPSSRINRSSRIRLVRSTHR